MKRRRRSASSDLLLSSVGEVRSSGSRKGLRRPDFVASGPHHRGPSILRGLLLTAYGFSVFGMKGEQVMTVAFIAALVPILASIAGLIHFIKTSKGQVVHFGNADTLVPTDVESTRNEKVLVGSA